MRNVNSSLLSPKEGIDLFPSCVIMSSLYRETFHLNLEGLESSGDFLLGGMSSLGGHCSPTCASISRGSPVGTSSR